MSSGAFFWNRVAGYYAKQPIADEAAYQTKLSHTQQYFADQICVLEFGCGTGSTAIYHAPKVKQILAIDISARMLEIARHKAREANISNLSFEKATLQDLECADESWDVVMGMSILHLLPDWQVQIDKVFALLKPGGVFVSSTICIADMPGRFKMIAPIIRFLPLLPNIQAFTQAELVSSMRQSGFEIEHEWRPHADKAAFIVARKPSS